MVTCVVKTLNKLSIIGGTFLASLACSVVAQTSAPDNSSPPAEQSEQAGPRENRDPLANLNLTEEQKDQVKPIMQKAYADFKAVKDDATLTPEQRGQKCHAIKQNTDDQLKEIFTPEQFQKFQAFQKLQAMRAEHKDEGKEGDRGRHNPFEKLNLSEEQQAQVKPIMQKAESEVKAVRENAALTPEQKKPQLQAIRENVDKQLQTILTPEQFQKLQQMRAERKDRPRDNNSKTPPKQ